MSKRTSTPAPEVEQPEVTLPENVGGVALRTVTLARVRTLHESAQRSTYQESVALAAIKVRGALPSVREVEVRTGISKSKVARMVAVGMVGIALQATASEGIDLLYLIEQGTGGLDGLQKAYGTPFEQADRADVLQWVSEQAQLLRDTPADERDRQAATRAARPSSGVTVTATVENKVEALRNLAQWAAEHEWDAEVAADTLDMLRQAKTYILKACKTSGATPVQVVGKGKADQPEAVAS